MKKLTKLIGIVTAMLLAAVITTQANGDHITAWNANCASYNFDSYPQSVHSTFRDMYNGSDIDNDFDDLMGIVEATGGALSPPPTPDVDSAILTQ